ncbi:metallophosphoesterase family protein [Paenibacillus piri]|uniref:Metallophosphoesterase n=1 Tax=Paenibacillus piri TaxID=2547395 RepID=A0A4R5KWF2_9BACL|nr:metallophosphoesterase [Paenibacillus piri]TDG00127.1 metallophosphoesterase [Paenibacillus piri]
MKLVLLGDFHYSRMKNGAAEVKEAGEHAYSAILDSFLSTDGQFHISLGDLTNEGVPEEFRYVLGRIGDSGRDFIHVLGNHDTNSIPKADIRAITGQQRYRAIDTEEAVLLILDSTKEQSPNDWGGEIDSEQTEWLRVQLEQAGEKPVLIFAHHPVYDTTALSIYDMLSIHPEHPIKGLLQQKKGPGFYFCGHNHVNSIIRQQNWHFIQTAACLDVPAIRTVELKDGQFRTELVMIDQPDLTDRIANFQMSMDGFSPASDARGEEADCHLQVELDK